MYSNSEDAIEANETVDHATARRELAKHHAEMQVPLSEAHTGDIFVRMQGDDEWETIACTTKAILEWLGY